MKKRKIILERQLQRKTAKRDELKKRALESESVEEVRAINDQLMELADDIRDITEELADIDERMRAIAEGMSDGDEGGEGEEGRACDDEERSTVPVTAQRVNGNIVAAFSQAKATPAARSGSVLDSMEYRTAFMNYFTKGTPIPAELRAGDAITSDTTSTAIPLTIVREVINTVRVRYGNLYRKVRKLAIQGGVEFPIGELQADFKWITEDTVSPDQSVDKLGTVSFGYHTAEIRLAQSFLSNVVTIEEFESKLSEIIVIAYLKMMDIGIVKGTGNGQMTGIINDSRVANNSDNIITMTAAEFSDWTKWRKKFFAKVPLGYRNGEFIFPMSTVDTYLETMKDNNNRPIFEQATGLAVNDGDAANPSGRFFGRDISIVEPTVLPDFDTASNGDVVGIFWQPEEYAVNENFGFTMRRYFDENRNKWINKALVVVDGKVLNPAGIFLIKKSS